MRPDEITAVGDAAGEGFGGAVDTVRDTHWAISGRVFRTIGEASAPVRVMHDAIASIAYGATRGIGQAVLKATSAGAGVARRPDAPSMEESVGARVAVGALSGAFGDRLAERDSQLAVRMALRRHGRDVEPVSTAALAEAYPDATARVVVFLHGLCETEDAWGLRSVKQRPYGVRLRDELGYTPVYVRYNSGLHISANGQALATLLDEVERSWPTRVHEIAFIGHSMGGLVARSACHYGAGCTWTTRVRHVFMLGTPHHGAPLERLANAASSALDWLPETRALSAALNARSAGIKDLHHGYLTDEDWLDRDPDAFLRDGAREIPFLSTANHYFVAASVARDHDHRFGRHVGDLLVLHASAWGHKRPGQRLQFPVENYRHLGRANHFDLLNHPAIGDQIVSWLGARNALPPPVAA